MHVYLQSTTEISTRMRVNDTIDVKANGYVLAPPTIHPDGEAYYVHQYGPIVAIGSLTEVLDVDYKATIQQSEIEKQRELDPLFTPKNTIYHGIIQDIKIMLPILTLANRYTQMRSSSDCGRWWVGRCPHPEHFDRKPSFKIDAVNNQASCWKSSCALHEPRGLDVIDLFARLRGIRMKDAIIALGMQLGLLR